MHIYLITNSISAVIFLLAPVLMLIAGWRGHKLSGLIMLACILSSIWFAMIAVYYTASRDLISFNLIQAFELLRDCAWLVFLFLLLARNYAIRKTVIAIVVFLLVIGLLILLTVTNGDMMEMQSLLRTRYEYVVFILFSILALVMIETIYRNSTPEARWAMKYLCIALSGIFAYDFFLYAHAILLNQLHPDMWNARGLVNAILVPFILFSVKRNPDWGVELFVSRKIIFHSTTITLSGIYLILMSAAGFYIREFGGNWGNIAQITFLFGAIVLLVAIFFSTQIRSHIKVFLAKHFYENKYEYREEWLKFTAALAEFDGRTGTIYDVIVIAISNVMDSRGGILWVLSGDGNYYPVSSGAWDELKRTGEPESSGLIRFFSKTGWVIDLDEYETKSDAYAGLEMPGWLEKINDAWLIMPLIHGEKVIAFLVLKHPFSPREFNWEDKDLLKTIGRQSANSLALLQVTEELSQARQFEAFNRVSAFIVHDLKNLIAQLGMVTDNAHKYKHDPAFIDDAFATIENAVIKMNRLLLHLRKGEPPTSKPDKVQLPGLIGSVIESTSPRKPVPQLDIDLDDHSGEIMIERDRLSSVLYNLIQNAQDATDESGLITVSLQQSGHRYFIRISDTGEGMDPEFIRNRLFTPFDTTKGNAGMGIGVFESREFDRSHGGDLTVESQTGRGTTFTITLPATQP